MSFYVWMVKGDRIQKGIMPLHFNKGKIWQRVFSSPCSPPTLSAANQNQIESIYKIHKASVAAWPRFLEWMADFGHQSLNIETVETVGMMTLIVY